MSENCHNCGKIPWSTLGDAISYKTFDYPDGTINYKWFIDNNKLEHFTRIFVKTIKDFSDTYKKPVTRELNPTQWLHGNWTSSSGAQICYFDSLFSVYILLNLILLNRSDLNSTTLLKDNTWIYKICSGWADLSHDKYMAKEFRVVRHKMFKRDNEAKNVSYTIVLTEETVKLARSYLKKVFECLIRFYQHDEDYYTEKFISDQIQWCLYGAKRI